MTQSLTLGNQLTITPVFNDANDLPLMGFGGEIVWTNDNPNAVWMQVANDNCSAIIVSLAFGTANISAALGSLVLTQEFVINTPASGQFVYGPPSGANSVIGRV